jgi:outer membrane protein
MKRILTAASLLAATLSVPAFAQTAASSKPATPAAAPAAADTAPAGPLKIGIIQFELAVYKTNEGQREYADLQKKYQPRKDKLDAENAEIQNLQKQLQASGEKLSEEERATRVRTIETKQKELQLAVESYQSDEQGEGQPAFAKIEQKVGEFMYGYAKANGYSMILEASAPSQQTLPQVLYAIPSLDITQAVIDGYNQKSGITAPPPASPALGAAATPSRRPAPAAAPAK